MRNISGLILKGPKNVEFTKSLESLFKFTPNPDQLLVQLKYAPINPSDFYFYLDRYADKKPFPCIPGFEGFGVVSEVGSPDNQHLIGKPCAVIALQESNSGTYASHILCKLSQAIILDALPNPADFEFIANPLTAIALLQKVTENKAESFIQNGGSTSVGKLVAFFNQKTKLPNISIVRNDKHKEELTALGVNEVLNSSDPNFRAHLKESIAKYHPTVAFDALAGRSSGELFNLLPKHSVQYVYGALEMKHIEYLDPAQLIFTSKEMKGFHLGHNFLKGKDIRDYTAEINECARSFKQAPGVKIFELADYEEAFKYFPQKQEKVLFKCS